MEYNEIIDARLSAQDARIAALEQRRTAMGPRQHGKTQATQTRTNYPAERELGKGGAE